MGRKKFQEFSYIFLGWAVTDQMIADNVQSEFSMVIHVGDVSYAGTGAEYEIEEIWVIIGNNRALIVRMSGKTKWSLWLLLFLICLQLETMKNIIISRLLTRDF